MVNRVRKAQETAADTNFSRISTHIVSIQLVLAQLQKRWDLDVRSLVAVDAIAKMAGNLRMLQEVHRVQGYSEPADAGIVRIAELIVKATEKSRWAGVPAAWIDSIVLSAEEIAELAKKRQEANRGP